MALQFCQRLDASTLNVQRIFSVRNGLKFFLPPRVQKLSKLWKLARHGGESFNLMLGWFHQAVLTTKKVYEPVVGVSAPAVGLTNVMETVLAAVGTTFRMPVALAIGSRTQNTRSEATTPLTVKLACVATVAAPTEAGLASR